MTQEPKPPIRDVPAYLLTERGPNGQLLPGHKPSEFNGVGRIATSARIKYLTLLKSHYDEDRFQELVDVLHEHVKAGQAWAIRLAVEYLCGPANSSVLNNALEDEMAGRIDTSQYSVETLQKILEVNRLMQVERSRHALENR